jgi:hypothetical protein
VRRFPAASIPCALALLAAAASVRAQSDGSLVYADFETVRDNRPVSARGGRIQITSYQESDVRKSTFKGIEGLSPPAPQWVRIKEGDPNHMIKIDYGLQAPNQFAGVSIEIQGQPEQDGKLVADDVSGYKELGLQIYVTGVSSLRVEAISHGQGIEFQAGYPQKTFRVQPGLNTYKIPIDSLVQPTWVETRGDPKAILKKLTSISITAFCDQCTPVQGMLIVDNVVFSR